MTSSEDDFCWTSASNSSALENMSSAEDNTSQNDYESETCKTYKKKLQKKLFLNNTTEFNESETEQYTVKNSKKRKIKEEPTDTEESNPKRRKIKVEPESDLDKSTKKKNKHKKGLCPNDDDEEAETLQYLNKKVKEEQEMFQKPTKKKRLKDNTTLDDHTLNSDSTIDSSTRKKHKKKTKDTDNIPELVNHTEHNKERLLSWDDADQSLNYNHTLNESPIKSKKKHKEKRTHREPVDSSEGNELSGTELKVKKKKHKKHQHCTEENGYVTENSENSIKPESTVLKKHKKKRKRKNSNVSDNLEETQNSSIYSALNETEDISAILHTESMINNSDTELEPISSRLKHNKSGTNVIENSDGMSERSDIESEAPSILNNKNKSILKQANVPKRFSVLERIRFEEDISDDINKSVSESINTDQSTITLLNDFMKSHPNLNNITNKLTNVLTDNDEIWQLTVPKALDITALENAKFYLDSKSKVKFNDETYVGVLDEKSVNRINMMYHENEELIFKNIGIKGTINLHKRIPKPHFMEDNIIVNRNSFIPLPETKCRHPLFGANYKADMKLPSNVRENLKKCSKLKTNIITEIGAQYEESDDVKIKKNKKRKRKLSEDDDTSTNKKCKYNPDAAETWESAKAIEETLFNF